MIFQHTIDKVLDGTKISTTRPAKPGDTVDDYFTCVRAANGRIRWRVGGVYAVQRGRGKKSEGKFVVKRIDPCIIHLSAKHNGSNKRRKAFLCAEGFDTWAEFAAIWREMHGDGPTPSWVIGFELVK